MMRIKLITHTPEPEKVIATAAKLCYSASSVDDLESSLTDDKIKSFLEMLMEIGHESPVEHVTFTFAIEGISRCCANQLVRHRIASYSQQSQRYVNMDQFEYVTPPSIAYANDPTIKDAYDAFMKQSQSMYDTLVKRLTEITYNVLTKDKSDEQKAIDYKQDMSKASKQANEDARFVLPNACETKIMVTMNIRSLYNFFKHRMCTRAQWEIRLLAWRMWEQCMEVSPTLFKYAGPSCIRGKCSEGKMSCGKAETVRATHAKWQSLLN